MANDSVINVFGFGVNISFVPVPKGTSGMDIFGIIYIPFPTRKGGGILVYKWLHPALIPPALIQLLVTVTTLLMVIRFGLDIYRHRSKSGTMRLTLLVLDTVTYTLLQYTLGLMKRPSFKNSYYQVWAVLLVTLRYSVKHGRPAGVALRQTPLLDMMSSFWAASILWSRAPSMLKASVWFLWTINSARIIHSFVSMEHATSSNKDNMRLVAEYMRREHQHQPSVAADPVTKKGYRYLVRGEEKQKKEARHPLYRLELKLTCREKLITLDKIWKWASDDQQPGQFAEGPFPGPMAGDQDHQERVRALLNSGDGKIKDLCFSFALYKLLRRRFYNLPIHESKLVKTKRLIFDGILGQGTENNVDPTRAFRITEAEISFLNDFFYSRHALIFAKGFPLLRLLLSTLLVGAISYMAFAIHQYSKVAKLDELGRVRHGVVFTWILLSMLGLKEIIEVAGYVFSDWTKVLLVCNYAKQPWWLRGCLMEKVVRMLCRCSFLGKSWHGKMGQYNLIFGRLERRYILALTDLTKEVQEAVLHALGSLSNPSEESYLDNAFKAVPLLAANENLCEKVHAKVNTLDGDVHRILLWHIATCYCELHLACKRNIGVARPWWVFVIQTLGPFRNMNRGIWTAPFVKESNLGESRKHYLTASNLSQYCAHVLRRNPPLIPGNEILNRAVVEEVIRETDRTLLRCYSISATFAKLQGLTQPQNREDEAANIQGMTEGPHREGSAGKDEVGNIQGNTERTHTEGSPGKDDAGNIQGNTEGPLNEGSPGKDQVDNIQGNRERTPTEGSPGPGKDDAGNIQGNTERTRSKGSPGKGEDEADKNILLKMGSELGQILIEEILKDETDDNFKVLWEFLEKLWAGFLIHLAQSTRASHHKLHLSRGGELITHIWALLSHAGLVGDVKHGELENNYTPDKECHALRSDTHP